MNVLFQFVVIALLITRLLSDLCYLYFAQHTENVFARETRSLVRENETKEKTLWTATTLQLLLGEGQVEKLSTKSKICPDTNEPQQKPTPPD